MKGDTSVIEILVWILLIIIMTLIAYNTVERAVSHFYETVERNSECYPVNDYVVCNYYDGAGNTILTIYEANDTHP